MLPSDPDVRRPPPPPSASPRLRPLLVTVTQPTSTAASPRNVPSSAPGVVRVTGGKRGLAGRKLGSRRVTGTEFRKTESSGGLSHNYVNTRHTAGRHT